MLEIKIGKTNIILPEELEQRFRKAVAKGDLQQATIEAIKDWIAEKQERF